MIMGTRRALAQQRDSTHDVGQRGKQRLQRGVWRVELGGQSAVASDECVQSLGRRFAGQSLAHQGVQLVGHATYRRDNHQRVSCVCGRDDSGHLANGRCGPDRGPAELHHDSRLHGGQQWYLSRDFG